MGGGKMIVYHGATQKVEHPVCDFGRPNLDFGKGFYVTDIKEQADICKLNGWGEKVFLRNLSRRLQEDWKDEALEMFNEAHPVLAVGMGATENLYSDRRAMTIVEIISPRKIVVQEN